MNGPKDKPKDQDDPNRGPQQQQGDRATQPPGQNQQGGASPHPGQQQQQNPNVND